MTNGSNLELLAPPSGKRPPLINPIEKNRQAQDGHSKQFSEVLDQAKSQESAQGVESSTDRSKSEETAETPHNKSGSDSDQEKEKSETLASDDDNNIHADSEDEGSNGTASLSSQFEKTPEVSTLLGQGGNAVDGVEAMEGVENVNENTLNPIKDDQASSGKSEGVGPSLTDDGGQSLSSRHLPSPTALNEGLQSGEDSSKPSDFAHMPKSVLNEIDNQANKMIEDNITVEQSTDVHVLSGGVTQQLSSQIAKALRLSEKGSHSEKSLISAKNPLTPIREQGLLRDNVNALQIKISDADKLSGQFMDDIDSLLDNSQSLEEGKLSERLQTHTQSDIAKRLEAKLENTGNILQSTRINTPFHKPEWGNAVSQRILWLQNQEISSAKIIMEPPELGPIEVHLKAKKESSQVVFYTHNSAVKEVLESTIPRLKEMFESQGLNLTDAGVHDQSEHGGFEQGNDTLSGNGTDLSETSVEEGQDRIEKDWDDSQSTALVDYYI